MKISITLMEKERIKSGLSKAELAKIVGITYYAYQAILKRGTTKISTLSKIGKALKINAKYLLT